MPFWRDGDIFPSAINLGFAARKQAQQEETIDHLAHGGQRHLHSLGDLRRCAFPTLLHSSQQCDRQVRGPISVAANFCHRPNHVQRRQGIGQSVKRGACCCACGLLRRADMPHRAPSRRAQECSRGVILCAGEFTGRLRACRGEITIVLRSAFAEFQTKRGRACREGVNTRLSPECGDLTLALRWFAAARCGGQAARVSPVMETHGDVMPRKCARATI
jgi:hypothetical protein